MKQITELVIAGGLAFHAHSIAEIRWQPPGAPRLGLRHLP